MSFLHFLVQSGDNSQVVPMILETGEDPNSRDSGGNTPLHIASLKIVTPHNLEGNLQVARELIRFGARVNEQNGEGFSPLHFAVVSRKPEMVRCLLQANADIDIRNNLLQTPLMLAAKFQNFQIVKELLKQGSEGNLRDSRGSSVMHYAFWRPIVETNVVEELLRHKCNHIVLNRERRMPLDRYIHNLEVAPIEEVLKAKYLFKLLIFHSSFFTTEQLVKTDLISRRIGMNLNLIYSECCKEIEQMKYDIFSFDCAMYAIASRGFYYNESERLISSDFYDRALDILINGKYPIYFDIILSGFCTDYLRKKFSRVCSNRENNGGFLNFDVLFLISIHLSHLEMFRMIIAFSSN